MNSRRVFFVAALVAAIALALAGAGPAHAAPPSGGITSPADGGPFESPDEVTIGVEFEAPATGRVTDVFVSLESMRGQRTETLLDAHGLSQSQYSGTWTASDLGPGVLDNNGEYEILARATATDGPVDPNPETSPSLTRSFRLAVPPVQPTGVKATFNESKRTVAVTWTGNPEPDLLGYVVQRAPKGGKPADLAEVERGQTHSYTDNVDTLEGEYSYSVVALRQGAEDVADADPTKPYKALPSAASVPATAAIAPAPTTTESTPGTEPGAGEEAGSTSTSTSSRPAFDSQGRVDLSGFAALLDQARAKPAAPRTTADPGYNDQLPFGSRPSTTGASTTGRPDVEIALADDDMELGGDERLRSMTFLAGGVFAFVLLMHLLWIRNEVKQAPLPVDEHGGHSGNDDGGPMAPIEPEPEPAMSNGRRPRRTGAGTLDSTPRKRSQGARGAPHRVPSRSRGDRREGRPAVRSRR